MTTGPQVAERVGLLTNGSAAKWLVLLSGLFLVIQVAATDYGTGPEDSSPAARWLLAGAALLWFVYKKHSNVARAVVVTLAGVGAAVYAGNALGDSHAALLFVAYAGQAVPLLLPAVRRHVTDRTG